MGGFIQRRGGTARHDAVAWGYARAADALGVDIIQGCEVTGFLKDGHGRIEGVETTRGTIRSKRIGCAAAGHESVLPSLPGFRRPSPASPLQALESQTAQPQSHTDVKKRRAH